MCHFKYGDLENEIHLHVFHIHSFKHYVQNIWCNYGFFIAFFVLVKSSTLRLLNSRTVYFVLLAQHNTNVLKQKAAIIIDGLHKIFLLNISMAQLHLQNQLKHQEDTYSYVLAITMAGQMASRTASCSSFMVWKYHTCMSYMQWLSHEIGSPSYFTSQQNFIL